MAKLHDLTGREFGRWTVLYRIENTRHNKAQWWCRCDCGTEKSVVGADLLSDGSTSCGCFNDECAGHRFRKHGLWGTPTHRTWLNMIQRCTNPKLPGYKNYGGRGITITAQWRGRTGFETFLKDKGERPPGMTLERKDNNGNYTVENTKWATRKEQSNNQRSNRYLTLNNRTERLSTWATEKGLALPLLYNRLHQHPDWPAEKILRPIQRAGRKGHHGLASD